MLKLTSKKENTRSRYSFLTSTSKQKIEKEHFHHILLYYLQKGKEHSAKLSDTYDGKALQLKLLNFATEDIKSLLKLFFSFFVEEDKTFLKRGITKLLEKWQKVIEQNGQYINKVN